ncbi:MAG: cell division protein FtsB [Lysobacter sp.]|nr:MAG: cell division protein FtsB [Lysobacter sp.]
MRALRTLLIVLVALLALLQYRLWLGEGGLRDTQALEARVRTQTDENRGLRLRNERLAAEVENLKSGEAAVEERARSELGMIKPGETFYRVVETPAPAAIDGQSADGANDAGANGASAQSQTPTP